MAEVYGRSLRLIASDIDGTILSYRDAVSGSVSRRTVEAFHSAREAGIQVVLVTGRPVRWLKPVSGALGTIGPVICSNGAVVYDLAEDRLLREDPLDARALFEAKDLIHEIDPQASFAAETLEHLHSEPEFLKDSLFFDEDRRRAAGVTDDILRLGPLDETLERDALGAVRTPGAGVGVGHAADRVVKLLVKTTAMNPDSFLEKVQQRAGHLLSVTHSAPGVSLLELSAKGVNKASALRRLSAERGVGPEGVAAFGDMPNDIEMLQWAGASWAVGSAHPMARSAARHVTADCDDDGVAQVIERLLEDVRVLP